MRIYRVSERYLPAFGSGNDLFFGHDSYKPYAIQSSYKLPIRNSSGKFEWDDWKVFLVSTLILNLDYFIWVYQVLC